MIQDRDSSEKKCFGYFETAAILNMAAQKVYCAGKGVYKGIQLSEINFY